MNIIIIDQPRQFMKCEQLLNKLQRNTKPCDFASDLTLLVSHPWSVVFDNRR